MWQKVATEMGIPWRSAESMHWQLGEQEMSARANAPVFQLHPSATSLSSPSEVPAVPASTPTSHGGFTPANAAQIMPTPPPSHHPGPMYPCHQRTDSGSSQGRPTSSSSFSRRRADPRDPRSRCSVPPQLQPLPRIYAATEDDLVSGARTAPTPALHSFKREIEGSNYMEPYQKRKWDHLDYASDLDARSQGGRMSPDRMSQRSGTGSIKSLKRESGEYERASAMPSPPASTVQ
jgi:hypothetical protein